MEACTSCDGGSALGGAPAPSAKSSSSWWSSVASFFGGGAAGTPAAGEVVDCVVRRSERRGRFVPENDPRSGQWYWIDRAAIAEHFNLDAASTLIVDAVDSLGGAGGAGAERRRGMPYPEPRQLDSIATATSVPVEHHYMYAGIWGSLALATQILATRARRRPVK